MEKTLFLVLYKTTYFIDLVEEIVVLIAAVALMISWIQAYLNLIYTVCFDSYNYKYP